MDAAAPVVVPEPEPEPDIGPLPDFVVEPGSQPSNDMPQASIESALEPEEEEDLGPLPDFVIDPNLPPELRPAPPPPAPHAPATPAPLESLQVPTSAKPEGTVSNAAAAGLYFPPTTAFPIRRDDDGEELTRERKPSAPRRPPAEPGGKKKRATEPAEPGDEAGEVGWMAGLSNRLSAYSLADEDRESAPSEAESGLETDESTED